MPVRLTYVSTLRPGITTAEIDALVAKAATFNKKHDITGVLAIDNRRVCQILEGPAEPVERLFVSIEKDTRHHSVTQIELRPIEASSFESWGMVRRDMIDMVLFALGA
jgi:hypothetical protein